MAAFPSFKYKGLSRKCRAEAFWSHGERSRAQWAVGCCVICSLVARCSLRGRSGRGCWFLFAGPYLTLSQLTVVLSNCISFISFTCSQKLRAQAFLMRVQNDPEIVWCLALPCEPKRKDHLLLRNPNN